MGALSPDGHGVRGELGLLAGAEEPLAGEAPEGRPEVDAVEGVDEGIDGAVEPSQPGEGLGQHLAGLVLGQKWCDQIVSRRMPNSRIETSGIIPGGRRSSLKWQNDPESEANPDDEINYTRN